VEVLDVEHPTEHVAINTQGGFVFNLNWGATLSETEEGSYSDEQNYRTKTHQM
jgi:hypothetical protein